MIELAIPGWARDDPKVTEYVQRDRKGDLGAERELFEYLLTEISDDDTREKLALAKAGSGQAREDLYDRLQERLDDLKKTSLFLPTEISAPAYATLDSWADLSTDAKHVAELIWRCEFLSDASRASAAKRLAGPRGRTQDLPASQLRLRQVAGRARSILLLALEVSLYEERAASNNQSRVSAGMPIMTKHRPETIRMRVKKWVKEYRVTLSAWDTELRTVTRGHFFQNQYGDSQQLKALSKVFGPSNVDEHEQGWRIYAADAENELRYRYREARRIESFRTGHPFVALWSLIQKVTTGYGTKPSYFARFTLFVIAIFWLLFLANDYFNPDTRANAHFCPAVNFSHTPWWEIAVHYLYIAVSNMTSLGTNVALAQYCGGMMTELLLVAASLTGYFLLATGAALIFQQIRDADS